MQLITEREAKVLREEREGRRLDVETTNDRQVLNDPWMIFLCPTDRQSFSVLAVACFGLIFFLFSNMFWIAYTWSEISKSRQLRNPSDCRSSCLCIKQSLSWSQLKLYHCFQILIGMMVLLFVPSRVQEKDVLVLYSDQLHLCFF